MIWKCFRNLKTCTELKVFRVVHFKILKDPGRGRDPGTRRTAIKRKPHETLSPATTANGDRRRGRIQTWGSRPFVILSSEMLHKDDDMKGFPTDPRDSSIAGTPLGSSPSPPGGHTAHPRGLPVFRESAMRLTVSLRSGLRTTGEQARLTPGSTRPKGTAHRPRPSQHLATDTMSHKDRKYVSISSSGTELSFRVLSRNAGGLFISVSESLTRSLPTQHTPSPSPRLPVFSSRGDR